ncbi:hypothetical protein CMI37_21265 [Candidatus Pacearchaeota archaeon]|nr:hypothetical protein [Candidatus Pacearchaeota archaeon]|tara:strand:- start:2669 stop:3094 length:426 start_codon:yes stop_codon:yes gene_type:complete
MGWTHLVHNKDLSTLAEISASTLGVDAVAGDVTTDGEWIKCAGYNQCTLMVFYDHSTTGGNLVFNIGVSNDGSTEFLLQTSSTSTGVATLSDLQYKKVTGTADKLFVVDFPINYEYFSIRNLALGGHANDKISITAFLGNI